MGKHDPVQDSRAQAGAGGALSLIKAMVSSKDNEWETPRQLFKMLNSEFNFTLDPCATHENHKCPKYFTLKENGLRQDWGNEVVFMNPPYGGSTRNWIKKAWHESKRGATVVCLIVSSTDRSYWHDYIFPYAAQIRFIRGKIKFSDAKSTAPFASAIVIFSKREYSAQIVYYQRKLTQEVLDFK